MAKSRANWQSQAPIGVGGSHVCSCQAEASLLSPPCPRRPAPCTQLSPLLLRCLQQACPLHCLLHRSNEE